MFVCVYVCIDVCMYVCVSVCMCRPLLLSASTHHSVISQPVHERGRHVAAVHVEPVRPLVLVPCVQH